MNFLNQVGSSLHNLTFYFQGEPYLNPDFLSMVSMASAKNIYTITSTNGHFLDKEAADRTIRSGLDRLIISLDGITQETYSEYRAGGELDKVLSGTREIIARKKALKSKTPHVIWQFVVFRHNEHQVSALKKLARETGVDEVKIKTGQIYDFDHAHGLVPEDGRYARYRKNEEGLFEIRNKLLNHCWRMWQGCVVTWDGKVVPCCFDKDATHKVGDITLQSFSEIWRSPAYEDFRNAVLGNRKAIDICTNCSEGTKVWA